MPKVNIQSQIQKVKAQFLNVKNKEGSLNETSLHRFIHKNDKKLDYALDQLASEIEVLDAKNPNIQNVLKLWEMFTKTLNNESLGNLQIHAISFDCATLLERICDELNKNSLRYQKIPPESPFSENKYFTMDLSLLDSSIRTKKFSGVYYLINEDNSFKRFAKESEVQKMSSEKKAHLRLADGYWIVDHRGWPLKALESNEVSTDQLKEIEILYEKIIKNSSIIKIEGSENFKDKVCSAIKLALTRPFGFQFFKELTDLVKRGGLPISFAEKDVDPQVYHGFITTKNIELDEGVYSKIFFKNNRYYLKDYPKPGHEEKVLIFFEIESSLNPTFNLLESSSSGSKKSQKADFFTMIMHELIHVYHILSDAPLTIRNRYNIADDLNDTNFEEQLTIYGRCPPLEIGSSLIQYCPYSENLFRKEYGRDPRIYHSPGTPANITKMQQIKNCISIGETKGLVDHFIDLFSQHSFSDKGSDALFFQNLLYEALKNRSKTEILDILTYFCTKEEMPLILKKIYTKEEILKIQKIRDEIPNTPHSRREFFVNFCTYPGVDSFVYYNFIRLLGKNSQLVKKDGSSEKIIWQSVLKENVLNKKIFTIAELIRTKNFSKEALKVAILSHDEGAARMLLNQTPSLFYTNPLDGSYNLIEELILESKEEIDYDFIQHILVTYREYIDFDKKGSSKKTLKEELKLESKSDPRFKNLLTFINLFEKTERRSFRGEVEEKLTKDEEKEYDKILTTVFIKDKAVELYIKPHIDTKNKNELLEIIQTKKSALVFAKYLLNNRISPYSILDERTSLFDAVLNEPNCSPKIFKLMAYYFDPELILDDHFFKDNDLIIQSLKALKRRSVQGLNITKPILQIILEKLTLEDGNKERLMSLAFNMNDKLRVVKNIVTDINSKTSSKPYQWLFKRYTDYSVYFLLDILERVFFYTANSKDVSRILKEVYLDNPQVFIFKNQKNNLLLESFLVSYEPSEIKRICDRLKMEFPAIDWSLETSEKIPLFEWVHNMTSK